MSEGWADVMDYGAVGDGLHDDTEAINRAIATGLEIVALVLALVEEFQSLGKSLLGWAVVFVCIALLWGHVA